MQGMGRDAHFGLASLAPQYIEGPHFLTYMKTLKTLSVSHSDRSLLTALNNIEQICIGDMLLLFSQSNKTAIGNFELARVEFMTQLSQSCIQAMSSRMFAHDEFRV